MFDKRSISARAHYCFTTAPPEFRPAKNRRFQYLRAPPYRGAPQYKASLYYWWWAYLKRNSRYQDTCKAHGKGALRGLYKDFGNIFNISFSKWWESHQSLFAECSGLVDNKNTRQLDRLQNIYVIDPNKSFAQITDEIRHLHLTAHNLHQGDIRKQPSTAKYPIFANFRASTLWRSLEIWDKRRLYPNLSTFDLGLLVGLEPALLSTSRETRSRQAIDINKYNSKSRHNFMTQICRYERRAAQLIENVGRGVFPKADTR